MRDLLSTLLRPSHFQLDQKSAALRAPELFGQPRLDFGDCLIIATMETAHLDTLYSFDHDFVAYRHINRIEPVA